MPDQVQITEPMSDSDDDFLDELTWEEENDGNNSSTTTILETSRTKLDENDSTPQPTRRLIKADMSLLQLDNFDEEDEEFLASPSENGHAFGYEGGCCQTPRQNGNVPAAWQRTVALDLATQTTSFKPERRHSITVCESPTRPMMSEVPDFLDKSHQPVSLPLQMHPSPDPSSHTNMPLKPNLFQSHVNNDGSDGCQLTAGGGDDDGDEADEAADVVLDESQWKNSMECLSLTLEEVVHIRNVLTKAELEGLLPDRVLYEEVSKGKTCFTCKKTRFSFFGQWRQTCRLCKRNICERCCTKMHIPTEHFASVPVFTLSPGSSSSGEDESPRSVWRIPDVSNFINKRMSVGSAPSSPNLPTKHIRTPSVPNSLSSTPIGTPTMGSAGTKRRPLLRSRTLNRADSVRREQLRGELMTVCKECRAMVRHAIVANRQTLNLNQKKNRASPNGGGTVNGGGVPPSPSHHSAAAHSRDLHLNLSPIYSPI